MTDRVSVKAHIPLWQLIDSGKPTSILPHTCTCCSMRAMMFSRYKWLESLAEAGKISSLSLVSSCTFL
jgi:hypothetical protein